MVNHNHTINKDNKYKYERLYLFKTLQKHNILNKYNKINIIPPSRDAYTFYTPSTHPKIHQKQIDTTLCNCVNLLTHHQTTNYTQINIYNHQPYPPTHLVHIMTYKYKCNILILKHNYIINKYNKYKYSNLYLFNTPPKYNTFNEY